MDIPTEITRQLRYLKSQIDKEHADDFAAAKREIMAEVTREIKKQVRSEIEGVRQSMADDAKKQMVAVDQSTREIALATSTQIGNSIYKRVVSEINTKIIPEIKKLDATVKYQSSDYTEQVDDYRKLAFEQYVPNDGKFLTDGKKDPHRVADHVMLLYSNQ